MVDHTGAATKLRPSVTALLFFMLAFGVMSCQEKQLVTRLLEKRKRVV